MTTDLYGMFFADIRLPRQRRETGFARALTGGHHDRQNVSNSTPPKSSSCLLPNGGKGNEQKALYFDMQIL
jgi:hypothetical protein